MRLAEILQLASSPMSFLRRDLKVGDDTVTVAPKPDGTSSALAEFVDNQRRSGSVIHKDLYLPVFQEDFSVKPGVSVRGWLDGLLKLSGLLLPQSLPWP